MTDKGLQPATTDVVQTINPAMKNFGFKEDLSTDPNKAESGGNDAFLFTKQWYYLKVGFRVDPDTLRILADVFIFAPSNPKALAQFSNIVIRSPPTAPEAQVLKSDMQSELKFPSFALDRIEIFNINISISNLKIYSGNFGDFVNSAVLAETIPNSSLDFSNYLIPYCQTGVNLRYLTVDTRNGKSNTNYNVTVVKDCSVCGISNGAKLNDPKGRLFPMVFDEVDCVLECSPWAREDKKTSSCIPFQSFLSAYDFSPASARVDQTLCGDTFLQPRVGEVCERFTTFFPDAENTLCNIATCRLAPNEKLICQKDLFGKSSCEACSISLCQSRRNQDFYFKSCLGICGYTFTNNVFTEVQSSSGGPTKSTGAIINGEKAYYVNSKTLTQIECDAANLNIQDKMNDPIPAISACQFCSQSKFYIFDETVKLCLEAPANPNRVWRNQVSFVTVSLIDILSLVLNIMVCVIAILSVLYLSSVASLSVVLKFWEVMEIFYLMSFYIDKHYMSNYIFRQFKFVTGEVFGFRGFLVPLIMKTFVGENGAIIVDTSYRNILTQSEFEQYKNLFEKFFENGKIGLFIYDAAPLLEILIFDLVVLSIVKVVLKFLKPSRNPNSFKARLKSGLKNIVPVFITFWFVENLPILTFFTLGQIFTLPSKISSFWNPYVMVNKVFVFLFTIFIVGMIPFYLIGISVKVFKDDIWLQRIKGFGFANTHVPMRTVVVLTMVRKILFAMYFNPAVNTTGSTMYCFFIILIQIVELTQLMFAKVYIHRVVQRAHIFGSTVFVVLSFLLMVDKLMISISELSTGIVTSSSGFMNDLFSYREIVLQFGVFLTIISYVFIIFYITIQGLRGKLVQRDKDSLVSEEKLTDDDDDRKEDKQMMELDFLDRRTLELAAL